MPPAPVCANALVAFAGFTGTSAPYGSVALSNAGSSLASYLAIPGSTGVVKWSGATKSSALTGVVGIAGVAACSGDGSLLLSVDSTVNSVRTVALQRYSGAGLAANGTWDLSAVSGIGSYTLGNVAVTADCALAYVLASSTSASPRGRLLQVRISSTGGAVSAAWATNTPGNMDLSGSWYAPAVLAARSPAVTVDVAFPNGNTAGAGDFSLYVGAPQSAV